MSTTNSLQRELESKSNLIKLIGLICSEYKLDHTLSSNIINIKSFLGPLRVDYITAKVKSLDEANAMIVKLYGDTIKSNRTSIPDDLNATKKFLLKVIRTPGDNSKNSNKAYKDTFSNDHEGIKESMTGLGSILDLPLSQRIETMKFVNYQSLFREEYILIDSRYQNKVNSDPTKLSFTLIGTTKTKSDHGGVIIGRPIKDIVEIEVYPFTIPYKPIYATFYNKMTLSINEWLSNSFEAYEGGKFHFCFDIDRIDNNLIYLRPVNSTYSFSSPVNYVDDFTLSFGAVFPKIAFDPDRMYPSSIDYKDQHGIFTFRDPHNLVTGDLIYITDFNTPEPARDVSIISEVNRPEGHVIVKKDNYSIVINVDLSSLYAEDPIGSGVYPIEEFDQQALVFFASKRIQIQMRLRYLTSYT